MGWSAAISPYPPDRILAIPVFRGSAHQAEKIFDGRAALYQLDHSTRMRIGAHIGEADAIRRSAPLYRLDATLAQERKMRVDVVGHDAHMLEPGDFAGRKLPVYRGRCIVLLHELHLYRPPLSHSDGHIDVNPVAPQKDLRPLNVLEHEEGPDADRLRPVPHRALEVGHDEAVLEDRTEERGHLRRR